MAAAAYVVLGGDVAESRATLPDLTVAIDDRPDPVAVGQYLSYVINIRNVSPYEASNVIVRARLSADVSLVSIMTPDPPPGPGQIEVARDFEFVRCVDNASDVECRLARLLGRSAVEVGIVVRPSKEGTVTATVSVSALQGDENPDNNDAWETTTVTARVEESTPTAASRPRTIRAPEMTVEISDSPDPVGVGQILSYNVTMRNLSRFGAWTSELVVTLPPEVTFDSIIPVNAADAPSSPGTFLIEGTATQGRCRQNGDTVTCGLLRLAGRDVIPFLLTVIPAQPGAITTTAQVSVSGGDSNPNNNVATIVTTVVDADPVQRPVSEVRRASAGAPAEATQTHGAALAAVEDLYIMLSEKSARVALLETRLTDLEAERGARYRLGPVSPIILSWLTLFVLASAGVFLARRPRPRGKT